MIPKFNRLHPHKYIDGAQKSEYISHKMCACLELPYLALSVVLCLRTHAYVLWPRTSAEKFEILLQTKHPRAGQRWRRRGRKFHPARRCLMYPFTRHWIRLCRKTVGPSGTTLSFYWLEKTASHKWITMIGRRMCLSRWWRTNYLWHDRTTFNRRLWNH